MVGTELARLLEGEKPESLYNSAWVDIDKIYDSLTEWNYTDFQQQIVPELFPPALFSSPRRKVGSGNRIMGPSLTTKNLHLGYPHRRFTDSDNNEWTEVWSALKSEIEGFKILRMVTLPVNFYADSDYSPGIDGLYVFKFHQGRNTVDDLHRYDRRWYGETGYPWV